MCVCASGREKQETVKVYNRRYSKAQVPSQISVGISTNSGNIGHHKPVKAAIEHLSSPVVICLDFPQNLLVSRILNMLELEDF